MNHTSKPRRARVPLRLVTNAVGPQPAVPSIPDIGFGPAPRWRPPPFNLHASSGIYRKTDLVPGMVTYYAVTSDGRLLYDQLVTVLPGEEAEGRAIADLGQALDDEEQSSRSERPLLRVTNGGRANVFAIRTPSAGLVRVGARNERDARSAMRSYTRSKWPLTWRELFAQGCRVVRLDEAPST
jgi:hypothetical protein